MHYPDGVSDVTDPRGDLQWGTLPGLVQDAAARFGEAEAIVDLHGPGGTVTRFGIPVDPGNLLFLGQLGARPVIGLPGCARSPALNGADWVLERLACGIEVTADDLSAMGVGGLLKEIPIRPQPRERDG